MTAQKRDAQKGGFFPRSGPGGGGTKKGVGDSVLENLKRPAVSGVFLHFERLALIYF